MTITKRNGKYYCRFQIDGERHHYLCSGATSVSEAKKIEDGFKYKLQQQQNGIIAKEDKKIKLSFLFDKFQEYSELNKKSYKQDISRIKILKEIFKNIKYAEDVKADTIEKVKATLLDRGLTKTTVNRYLEILSKMFNIGINNEWLSKNPVKKDSKFPLKNYTTRTLSKEEEERLFEVLPSYLKELVFVALQTGLRAGNLITLQWEQIHLEDRYIEILENKGNKHIILPINDSLYFFLKKKLITTGFVFINPATGKPIREYKRAWHTALKKAKIDNFRFHDLRHTVGSRLAEKGVPIPVIKDLLAHTDVKTTMRYVHTKKEQLTQAVSVLNSYN